MLERRNSIANALELRLSCTNLSIYTSSGYSTLQSPVISNICRVNSCYVRAKWVGVKIINDYCIMFASQYQFYALYKPCITICCTSLSMSNSWYFDRIWFNYDTFVHWHLKSYCFKVISVSGLLFIWVSWPIYIETKQCLQFFSNRGKVHIGYCVLVCTEWTNSWLQVFMASPIPFSNENV